MIDKLPKNVRYLLREVGLAMCQYSGSISDTLIGPFFFLKGVATMRVLTRLDRCIIEIDKALRTIIPPQQRHSQRDLFTTSPETIDISPPLSLVDKKHVAGLMRVNHAGEVCAQALYQGQALTAELQHIRSQLEQAAHEETEHLAWCEQRLRELHSHPSLLNPIWYFGSLVIGIAAGLAGDKWSLGFVAETERQVSAHLQSHIAKLPPQDKRTRIILEQMHSDETAHAHLAERSGAAQLPYVIQKLMQFTAKLMTKTSYYF